MTIRNTSSSANWASPNEEWAPGETMPEGAVSLLFFFSFNLFYLFFSLSKQTSLAPGGQDSCSLRRLVTDPRPRMRLARPGAYLFLFGPQNQLPLFVLRLGPPWSVSLHHPYHRVMNHYNLNRKSSSSTGHPQLALGYGMENIRLPTNVRRTYDEYSTYYFLIIT